MAAKSGAEILKEFIVSIGFKVDEQQLRKFSSTLLKVGGAVTEIAAAVGVATAVIDRNVNVMAARFEKLYYSSQRTGATVRSLQNLEYGAQQIGFAAGTATGQIEAMQTALRTTPGLARMFGIRAGDNPTQQYIKIIKDLRDLSAKGAPQHALAAMYASRIGLSEPDLVQAEKNVDKLEALVNEHDARLRRAGLDPDKVAANSVRFENDMVKLQDSIDILRSLLLERFMPIVDRLVNGIGRIVGGLNAADRATGGATTYGLGAAGVVGALGAGKVAMWGLRKLAKRSGLAAGEAAGGAAAEGAGAGALAGVIIPIVTAVLIGLGLGWLLKKTGALDVGGQYSAHSQVDQLRKWMGLGADGGSPGEGGIAGNNPGNMRRWGAGQATFSRGKSGMFVAFNSAQEGLSAMAGQLLRFGSRGVDTVSGLANNWLGKSDAENPNRAAYIAGIAKRLGVGADQHLNLGDAGTLQALLHAIIVGEQGRDPYSASTLRAAVNQRLARDGSLVAGNNHSFTSETHITVNGAGDPKQVGRSVGDEQARVNQDAMRNMQARVN